MKLYNKGGRALILDPKEIKNGGRYLEHDKKKEKCYFDPNANIEVTDGYGNKLLGMYGGMIMRTDTPDDKPKKKRVAKKAVKVG